MSILKAYLLPHPPLAVPAVGRGEEKKIEKTLSALDEIAQEIAELAPESIIIITPHVAVYTEGFLISSGEHADSGNFARFGAPETVVTVRFNAALAQEIASIAPNSVIADDDDTLDHGTTVPLWYINQAYTDYTLVRISQSSGLDSDAHYQLGRDIAKAAQNHKVVLIASGDLSHKLSEYGPYGYAADGVEFDKIITQAIADSDFTPFFNITDTMRTNAAECGYNSLMVLAGCLHGERINARLLSYECPFGVGYAVASFQKSQNSPQNSSLDPYQELARQSLEHTMRNNGKLSIPQNLPTGMTQRKAGVFVSLHKNGQLRGCIGTIAPTTENIAHEIIQNAVSAGLSDLRFDAVTPEELPHINYKVDVLSEAEPIPDASHLDVKRYGVIVSAGMQRGLLLPNLDGIDSVEQQITIASQKAGIRPGTPVKLERFEVVRHG